MHCSLISFGVYLSTLRHVDKPHMSPFGFRLGQACAKTVHNVQMQREWASGDKSIAVLYQSTQNKR
jgi:hypothetical protein